MRYIVQNNYIGLYTGKYAILYANWLVGKKAEFSCLPGE